MRKIITVILSIALLFQFSACNSQTEETPVIRVSGAWALYPMMLVWADAYAETHNVEFEIGGGGAGKGMSDVLNGQVDIGMVSRPVKEEELEQGAFYIAVAKDTVIGIVNEKNPVYDQIIQYGLSQEDLRKIFMKEVTEWGELFNMELEDDTIVVYARSDSSGAASVWATYLGGYTEADLQNASDANVSGDQAIASSVLGDSNAISFTNMNYAYDSETGLYVDGIRPVQIDLNDDGVINEDEDFYSEKSIFLDNVAKGVYPSPPTREEYLVANKSFEGVTKEFVEWILSDEGQSLLAENGYVALLEDEQQAESSYLEKGSRN